MILSILLLVMVFVVDLSCNISKPQSPFMIFSRFFEASKRRLTESLSLQKLDMPSPIRYSGLFSVESPGNLHTNSNKEMYPSVHSSSKLQLK